MGLNPIMTGPSKKKLGQCTKERSCEERKKEKGWLLTSQGERPQKRPTPWITGPQNSSI